MPRTSLAEREAMLKGFIAPKQFVSDGFVFENAKGGPYKYGRPIPATRLNILAVEAGIL